MASAPATIESTAPRGREAAPRAVASPRTVRALLRRLLRLFFRRIEVVGADNVAAGAGGVLIAWHPNGLLDPALILAHFPKRVVFGARHGLLRWPLLGALMRHLGTVPIYRPQDAGGPREEGERREANQRSVETLARAVAEGSFAALFPEGLSHDEPRLMALRPGAARLYLRARELTPPDREPPVVIPVGLHYDRKNLFGSDALVEFHPPIELPSELAVPAATEAERKAQAEGLTRLFDAVLTEVVQATESWQLHQLMHRLRKVFRAERAARALARPGKPTMRERVLGLARVRRGYLERLSSHPEETDRVLGRVQRYDKMLHALGLEDHELDRRADLGSPWRPLALVAQAVAVYLLLPPLLVLGYAVNYPVALALGALARRLGAKVKDEASLKLLLAAGVFPVVWLGLSLLVAWGEINLHQLFPQVPEAPWLAGVATFLLCAVGGWAAVCYTRLAAETYRALRVRLTRTRRRRTVARLARERAAIYDAALALSTGLDLPGAVAADGRITAEPL
ncbi:MAG TPA: 1-acyl-sn-glycerol-3-phosphate acyltransferase [Thermoanaerobaculia bacterium]|nr:1-acyl-sn-glycerol-3-phosphate acyltransferase [Thermoanaerobaculia bacterium]